MYPKNPVDLIKRQVCLYGWKFDANHNIFTGNVSDLQNVTKDGLEPLTKRVNQLDKDTIIELEARRFLAIYALKLYQEKDVQFRKDNKIACHNAINNWLSVLSKSEHDHSLQTYLYDFRAQDPLHAEAKDGLDVIERETITILFSDTQQKKLYDIFNESILSYWIERLYLFFLHRYDFKDAKALLSASNLTESKRISRCRKYYLPTCFITGMLVGYFLVLMAGDLHNRVEKHLTICKTPLFYTLIIIGIVSICYFDVSKKSKALWCFKAQRTCSLVFRGAGYLVIILIVHSILTFSIDILKLSVFFGLSYFVGLALQLSWHDRSLMDDL